VNRLRRKPIYALLGLYFLLALLYSAVVPVLEAPDAIWHFQYVRYLVQGRGLPYYQGRPLPMEQEASQPPLYYLLGIPFVAPINMADAARVLERNPQAAIGDASTFANKNIVVHPPFERFPYRQTTLAIHSLRLLSIFLGLIGVYFSYRAMRLLFGETLGLWVSAMIAFVPQFVFMNAVINNDNLVTTLGIVAFALLLALWAKKPALGQIVALGIVLGLAALAKLSGLVLVALAVLLLFGVAAKYRLWRKLLLWYALLAFLILAVAGWFYFRNLRLYGDPTGLRVMFAIYHRRAHPPSLAELLALFDGVFKSFWAVFGWFNVVASPWVYKLLYLWSALGSLGFILFWLKTARRRDWDRFWLWAIVVAWALTYLLALVKWAQMRFPQGRMLFPALPAIMAIWVRGWLTLLPRRVRRRGLTGMATLMFLFAAVSPLAIIGPAYAEPPLVAPSRVPQAMRNADITFGHTLRLLGARVTPRYIKPGQVVRVYACWEMLQPTEKAYSLVLQAWGRGGAASGEPLISSVAYPGRGGLPTNYIPAGKAFCETRSARVPRDTLAPVRLRIELGVYDVRARRALPKFDRQGRALSLAIVGDAAVVPRRWPKLPVEATPLSYDFADGIQLRGFARQGNILRLFWGATHAPAHDYTVFVHVVDAQGKVVRSRDAMPLDGDFPTSLWPPGALVPDVKTLDLATLPPGPYTLKVGLYRLENMQRLPVSGPEGAVPDGAVPLARFILP